MIDLQKTSIARVVAIIAIPALVATSVLTVTPTRVSADPFVGALGGALLGGLITGRSSGIVAGAVIGGVTGAIVKRDRRKRGSRGRRRYVDSYRRGYRDGRRRR